MNNYLLHLFYKKYLDFHQQQNMQICLGRLSVGERIITLGVFKKQDDPNIEEERTAILALLNKLGIEGLECVIEAIPTPQQSLNVIVKITWPAKSELKDLQYGRRIDQVIEQTGKRG